MNSILKLFLLAAVLLVSCGKDDTSNGPGPILTGKNKLVVSVIHHTYAVAGVSVFLKNNATEFPGFDSTMYEWQATSDPSGIAVFENLFEGNYFLYAKGFDPFVGLEVIGAAPAVLNSSTLTNNEIYVTLSVTE